MNEREAWAFLATLCANAPPDEFMKPAGDLCIVIKPSLAGSTSNVPQKCSGLCRAIDALAEMGHIDELTKKFMKARLQANKPTNTNLKLYWWDQDRKGWNDRAAHCSRMESLAAETEVQLARKGGSGA